MRIVIARPPPFPVDIATEEEKAGWRLKAVRDDCEHRNYHFTGGCLSVREEFPE